MIAGAKVFISLFVAAPLLALADSNQQTCTDLAQIGYIPISYISSTALSADGKVLAIGAPFWKYHGNKTIRVYEHDGETTWKQKGQNIDEESAGHTAGQSISLSRDGNILAIGAPYQSRHITGRVRVYIYDEEDGWTERSQNINGESASEYSAPSVSLSGNGDILAIGAPYNDTYHDENNNHSGHVRVFIYDEEEEGWTQRGQDIDGESEYDISGSTISISENGNVLAFGARVNAVNNDMSGFVRVFVYDEEDGWTQRGQNIDGESAGDDSGMTVSLSGNGDIVAIGATNNDDNGSSSGHVRVFIYDEERGWTQRGQDIDGESKYDDSGSSISLSGDGYVLAIGAPYNDGNGFYSGHVRVFVYDEEVWSQIGCDIDGESEWDYAGSSVSLSENGNILAIGASKYTKMLHIGRLKFVVDNEEIFLGPPISFITNFTIPIKGSEITLTGDGEVSFYLHVLDDANEYFTTQLEFDFTLHAEGAKHYIRSGHEYFFAGTDPSINDDFTYSRASRDVTRHYKIDLEDSYPVLTFGSMSSASLNASSTFSNFIIHRSLIQTEAGSSKVKIQVSSFDVLDNAEEISDFVVKIHVQESANILSEVFGSHETKLTKKEVLDGKTFYNLEPGRHYTIRLIPLDSAGNEVETSFPIKGTASTHCSCQDKLYSQDVPLSNFTGHPTKLSANQTMGHVYFSFQDNSVCEDAYVITRSKDVGMVTNEFVSNYSVDFPTSCDTMIVPGRQASDDLRLSKLSIGDDYEYCVCAVADPYMPHPLDEGLPSLTSSTKACVTHKIRWEASIEGKITTEPNAGRLPIKDVNVQYALLDENFAPIECDGCSGSTVTGEGGTFEIAFNVDNETLYNNDTQVEYPVKVNFNKTISSNFEDKFLCNEGEDDCSGDIGTIVYLSHLQFKEPLHVYDGTRVHSRGNSGVEVCTAIPINCIYLIAVISVGFLMDS